MHNTITYRLPYPESNQTDIKIFNIQNTMTIPIVIMPKKKYADKKKQHDT